MAPSQLYERVVGNLGRLGEKIGLPLYKSPNVGAPVQVPFKAPIPDDFNYSFVEPIKESDIVSVVKVSAGHSIPPTLEGIIDLMEGRDHMFYLRLQGGNDILAKPYNSENEREVLKRLKDLGVSHVISLNDAYFVEEKPRTPSIERTLTTSVTSFREVSNLFGRALYLLHSSGVGYDGSFEHHVHADTIANQVKISNFSSAKLTSEPNQLMLDIIMAFKYMETLALKYNVKEREFIHGVAGFIVEYVLPRDEFYRVDGGKAYLIDRDAGTKFDASKTILNGSIDRILSSEDPQSLIVTALKKFKHKK